jgi:capsular polysaccharide biosynthesis protein
MSDKESSALFDFSWLARFMGSFDHDISRLVALAIVCITVIFVTRYHYVSKIRIAVNQNRSYNKEKNSELSDTFEKHSKTNHNNVIKMKARK